MLQVARLSPKLLAESKELVVDFLLREQRSGVFQDRSGNPDLYYTVFGLECLRALSADLPDGTRTFLEGFGTGETLDLVHLSSLIRCWANIDRVVPHADALAAQIEKFRTADGGYGISGSGTLYGSFLAAGAYQELQVPIPRTSDLLHSIRALRSADGGFSNQAGSPLGQTSATAAAVGLLRMLQEPVPQGVDTWLLKQSHSSGGFFAAPQAPIPDLLSTATALHALVSTRASIEGIREPALDFLDTLWTTRGGFLGSWADDILDCEYTYYGLLSLGYLSL
jgi:prenyltransferase beta subunit